MAQLKEGSIIKKSTGDEVIATLNDLNTHKAESTQQADLRGLEERIKELEDIVSNL